MARKAKTTTFDLLCGYLEEPDDPRGEEESDDDYNARCTLHTSCTVREMDQNVDKDIADRDIEAVDLLARHLVQVGDITDSSRLQKEVAPALLKGDYDWVLLRMRILSLTADYDFKVPCPNKECMEENLKEVDLNTIEVVDMPDPYHRRLVYATDDGIEMVFRLFTAEDLDALAEISDENTDELRHSLGLRLVSIDGVTPEASLKKRGRKCKTVEQGTREAVRLLDKAEILHRERVEIREKLQEMSGYPKLIVKSRCKFCRRTWRHRIVIDLSFFLRGSEI